MLMSRTCIQMTCKCFDQEDASDHSGHDHSEEQNDRCACTVAQFSEPPWFTRSVYMSTEFHGFCVGSAPFEGNKMFFDAPVLDKGCRVDEEDNGVNRREWIANEPEQGSNNGREDER